MEAVSQTRRALPQGGEIAQDYVFDGLGSDGHPVKIRLSELFRDGTDTLLVYNYMFPRHKGDPRDAAKSGEIARLPKQDQPCPSCTALLDQLNGAAPHYEAGGGNFAVVANAALNNLLSVARDRDWRHLRLLSSGGNSFKRNYHAEDAEGQQEPMTLVFKRDPDGTIRLLWLRSCSMRQAILDSITGRQEQSSLSGTCSTSALAAGRSSTSNSSMTVAMAHSQWHSKTREGDGIRCPARPGSPREHGPARVISGLERQGHGPGSERASNARSWERAMVVRRIVTNIATQQVDAAHRFYGAVLGLEVVMDLGWIVTFAAEGGSGMPQISIATEGGSGTPVPDISIEVDNLDEVLRRVVAEGLPIEYGPTREPWGVTRFYVRDPFGRLINILTHP